MLMLLRGMVTRNSTFVLAGVEAAGVVGQRLGAARGRRWESAVSKNGSSPIHLGLVNRLWTGRRRLLIVEAVAGANIALFTGDLDLQIPPAGLAIVGSHGKSQHVVRVFDGLGALNRDSRGGRRIPSSRAPQPPAGRPPDILQTFARAGMLKQKLEVSPGT